MVYEFKRLIIELIMFWILNSLEAIYTIAFLYQIYISIPLCKNLCQNMSAILDEVHERILSTQSQEH